MHRLVMCIDILVWFYPLSFFRSSLLSFTSRHSYQLACTNLNCVYLLQKGGDNVFLSVVLFFSLVLGYS